MARNKKTCAGEQTKPPGARHNVSPQITKRMTTIVNKGGG